jgi:hypothetical protein
VTGISRGRTRQLKSCVGKLDITKKQASRLGVPAYKRLSPVLETCCLLLSANESYKVSKLITFVLIWQSIAIESSTIVIFNSNNLAPSGQELLSRPSSKLIEG